MRLRGDEGGDCGCSRMAPRWAYIPSVHKHALDRFGSLAVLLYQRSICLARWVAIRPI